MDRRGFVLGAGACALPVAASGADLPIPARDELAFDVFRNGDAIGAHHIAFDVAGDAMTIATMVSLAVTVASIVVFRYEVQATERWAGGVFQSLDSSVNFNGDALQVHAEKVADGYEVQGVNQGNPAKNMARYLAPPDTLPLTYWNKRMLSGTILNIQTAHCYKCPVASPGWNSLPTASGGSVVAQRFDVTGKLRLSVWYDATASWSGLEFNKGGDISYRKIVRA